MHNAAFEAVGVNAHYEARDVAPENLAEVVASLRDPAVLGANVTIPYKLEVLPLMDSLTNSAEAIGAVNTIVNRQGRLLGHNTDASGFLRALQEDAKLSLSGATVVMFGAGGAARAVAYALLGAGIARLQVYNRTAERAEGFAADFGTLEVLAEADLAEAVHQADLLVNTTSAGMERNGLDPDVSPLPAGVLPRDGFVCDLVYRPERTRLLKDAEASGLRTQNGLSMLVYQGAEAFHCWTGRTAPVEVMLAAARAALAHKPSRARKSG